jgi:hypothetical protein
MGFRDSKQRSDVCYVLLKMKDMQDLIKPNEIGEVRMTEEAVEHLRMARGGNSKHGPGKATLIRAAFDFYNGDGGATIHEVLHNLEPGVGRAIGELMTATAQRDPVFIDDWVKQWDGFDLNQDYFAS